MTPTTANARFRLARLADSPRKPERHTALLVASGDSRLVANMTCWPAQQDLERQLLHAFRALGWSLQRAHPERRGSIRHGFIDSPKHGRDVFAGIHPDAPLVVAVAAWQFSSHVLIGLQHHRGPVLVAANWSGRWPGVVGALNLRGSLTAYGVEHSLVWAEDFGEHRARRLLKQWCDKGRIRDDLSHAAAFDPARVDGSASRLAGELAARIRRRPPILGVFDEGCMGMANAVLPDRALRAAGVVKERFSQAALFAAMQSVTAAEARAVRAWLVKRGMRFRLGRNPASELTEFHVLEQCRMYVAAARIAHEHGCDAIGIQYQLGLANTCASSDLAEGLLNCSMRPPVRSIDGARIAPGRPIPHFNEADEGAGLDAVLTDRVWSALRIPPDNTLHDLRWGDWFNVRTPIPAVERDHRGMFVWTLEISGAVPPSHLDRGYRGAVSERQPPMYFERGGGSIKGVSRPGEVVWSRVYSRPDRRGRDRLHIDIGLCRALRLPRAESQRRWSETTSQWPMMHAAFYGVSRAQMMAKHQANHIQVAYAPDEAAAVRALAVKAALAAELGIRVNLCGTDSRGVDLAKRLRTFP